MMNQQPPSESFSLRPLWAAEDIAKAVEINRELAHLLSLADEHSPRIGRAERRAAVAAVHANPTEGNFFQLVHATAVIDSPRAGNAVDLGERRRYKRLRTAAHLVAWKFYGEQGRPFLNDLFQRAIAHLEEEIAQQKSREAAWAADFERFALWGRYYSCPLPAPRVSHVIEGRAADLRKTILAIIEQRPVMEGRPTPPLLNAALSVLQLPLPAAAV